MKKVILVVAIAAALIGLMAAPALAKPVAATFDTGLQIDNGATVTGTLSSGFTVYLHNTLDVFHNITLAGAAGNLANGMYGFTFQAKGAQKAALSAYFAAKGWPAAYLTQINSEISGGSPFFYLVKDAGGYSLVDGFSYTLFGTTAQTLRIDDDYPIGTYVYKGHAKATSGALLQITITLIVTRF